MKSCFNVARPAIGASAAALLACDSAFAQPAPDKSGFSLWNPTPRELWRPLSADRPDVTESPYTVDAGAVQLEMSFIDYARNGDAETISVVPFNLKLGLLHNLDLQFVFDPYLHDDDGARTRDGVGDMQLRLKMNFFGNDDGDVAFGLMPFVKFPTASDGLGNDELEGGLIVPLAIGLSERLSLGLMVEFDAVHDEIDDDYDMEVVHTASLGFAWSEPVGLYAEYIGVASTDGDYRPSIGSGITLGVTDDLQFDAGLIVGLGGDADDLNLFTGMTIRF